MVENQNLITSELYSQKYELEDDVSLSTDDNNLDLSQQDQNKNVPTFGAVSVTNSTDIHFGNKTIYQGPVTIKQIVYANNSDKKEFSNLDVLNNISAEEKGSTNSGFVSDSVIINSDTRGHPNSNVFKVIASSNKKENKPQPTNLADGCNDKPQTDISKQEYRWKKFLAKHQMHIACIILMMLILALGGFMAFMLLYKSEIKTDVKVVDSDEQIENTPIHTGADSSSNILPKLKILSRLEWLAQPPKNPATPLKLPVPYVIIWHTATENCTTQAQCVFQVRYIQTFHMESQGWWDIGYNFLVGGDGQVYEGRGWKAEGAHTYAYNSKSIGISFVGTFSNYKPTNGSILACKRLIKEGVRLGYISKDYKLYAARQLRPTESPGAKFFTDIINWPHWSNMTNNSI